MASKNKKKGIPPRFHDQAESHRLHRSEQPQYPDDGEKGSLEESGQAGGERNPRDVRGNEGGGNKES